MERRQEQFEKMLAEVRQSYADTAARMEQLREEGKTKTVTYRELMGRKLFYQEMLALYRRYGLTER